MISVIVPVYNVEKYVRKCIESILAQTYSAFELILIDDGSTDESGSICDEYAEKQNVLVIHKENGGLADARNAGIEMAHGDYITFVDSDDFLKRNFLEKMNFMAQDSGAQIIVSKLIDYYEENKVPKNSCDEIEYKIISRKECYKKMLLQDEIDVNATAKMYSKDIFRYIRFVKGMLYEDINIVTDIFEGAEKICVSNYAGYYYLQRKDSIMYGSFSLQRMSLLRDTEKIIELMKEKYPENIDAARYRNIYCMFHLLGRSILDDHFISESRQIRTNILDNVDFILNSGLFNTKEIVATVVLKCGLNFYRMVWRLYKKIQ